VAGINHYNLDKAMVITNSCFSQSAIELAKSNNVILWDRNKMKEKLEEIDFNDMCI
jgi:HJR/Mrr/RecB family endonuclease